MKKRILALSLSLCLTLCGCASLLERSYSSVEPYTDRYWDSGVEDTLKAESYQDLVNSLLMLIEQRSEEVVIRYYAPAGTDSYSQAVRAKHEVQNETLLGAYLLESLSLAFTNGDGYSTLVYSMTYRRNTQDISSLMALSDSQSLVDLLRMAVREGHSSLTAQFITRISREEVQAAVDQLWQELYLDELEASGLLPPSPPSGEDPPDETPDDEGSVPSGENGEEPAPSPDEGETGEEPDEEPAPSPDEGETGEEPDEEPDVPPDEGETGEEPDGGEDTPDEEPEEPAPEVDPQPVIEFPPCPWTIIFYPNSDSVEIVEIILK